MKERIRNAIEAKLAEQPESEHLQRQATLIHSARSPLFTASVSL